ncbi:LysR family transcriptional regulator [Pseudoruegeria sp. SHC-113]|uniref:LysR family transcriptional regulator n=1 Tax=Pseudoruegeria sp. SHC-113 TaxID=2855439 RepID=UPI0021BB6915|nr:LysR family transcriptional regulator [Pseudoruegeria sp. SHC-113]MCT8159117.1 LysR family transcriptional regulator [Pseudoruegeria sp. SHC-113]
MNWQAISFDWNQIRAFLATVEEGSLSAAARALGQTQPTLGRQVAALEESLGVVLFERTGKALTLTPSGLELLDHVRAMGEAASRISLAASGQSQAVEGRVAISCTDVFAAYILPPLLHAIQQSAPGIEITVVAENALSDLLRREADIAIRHVRPEQPDLIARRLPDSEAFVYATPAYLDSLGRPLTNATLEQARLVSIGDSAQMRAIFAAQGVTLSEENVRLTSTSGIAGWEMVRHGLGIMPMERRVAEACGGLESVFPDMAPIPVPIWLTTHRELHTSRRIRLTYDLLYDQLSALLRAGRRP